MDKKIKIVSIVILATAVLSLIKIISQNNSTKSTGLFTLHFAGENVQRSFASSITPDTNLTITLRLKGNKFLCLE